MTADNHALNTFSSAMIGGTASELTGGKFANGAAMGAFQYAFNQAMSDVASSLKRKSFYDGFDEKFLSDFRKNNPVEFKMFKEYATNLDMSLFSDDFRYYELAWRGFETYAGQQSLELLNLGAKDAYSNLYGAQNMLSSIPGKAGVAFSIYNDAGTTASAANLMSMTNEILNIQFHGPQVINQETFRSAYGTGYDPSLNSLVK